MKGYLGENQVQEEKRLGDLHLHLMKKMNQFLNTSVVSKSDYGTVCLTDCSFLISEAESPKLINVIVLRSYMYSILRIRLNHLIEKIQDQSHRKIQAHCELFFKNDKKSL